MAQPGGGGHDDGAQAEGLQLVRRVVEGRRRDQRPDGGPAAGPQRPLLGVPEQLQRVDIIISVALGFRIKGRNRVWVKEAVRTTVCGACGPAREADRLLPILLRWTQSRMAGLAVISRQTRP